MGLIRKYLNGLYVIVITRPTISVQSPEEAQGSSQVTGSVTSRRWELFVNQRAAAQTDCEPVKHNQHSQHGGLG